MYSFLLMGTSLKERIPYYFSPRFATPARRPRLLIRRLGTDLVDAEIGAGVFLFLAQTQTERGLQTAIDDTAAGQRAQHAESAQRRTAEKARGDAAPHAAQAVQRPYAEHVVDLPFVLGEGEGPDEQRPGHRAGDQRAYRMHELGAGAYRHQASQRAVMDESGIVAARDQRRQHAAHHRHQRIQRDEAVHRRHALRRHHIEAEPADGEYPGTERQKRDAGRRVRGHSTVFGITTMACAQEQYRHQSQPAADGVHHHRTGEVEKLGAEMRFQPRLQTKVAVPGNAFEERIAQPHQQGRSCKLRIKPGALGDAAGNDGGNRRGERQQEEKFNEFITAFFHQGMGIGQKRRPVGDGLTDEEIRQGGHRKIRDDFYQRVYLVFFAYRPYFQKSEAGVHGQHHHGAHQ